MYLATQLQRPLPDPLFESPHQSGITDPRWPLEYPNTLEPEARRDLEQHQIDEGRVEPYPVTVLSKGELQAKYISEYAGHVARQDFQTIMRADVLTNSRYDLIRVLQLLSRFAMEEMLKKPSHQHVRLLEEIPESYRVTLTIGFGASLFVDSSGFDRFGLRAVRPNFLKRMPRFKGDAETFSTNRSATDLIIVISSDHPYVNVAIARFFAEYFNLRFQQARPHAGPASAVLAFRGVEEGFARKDKREFLRFDDGIDNLHMNVDELMRLVYVDHSCNEPDWCVNGTYLVYRKIRENMPHWEALDEAAQEQMIGRRKDTGEPLSRQKAGHDRLTPVFPDPNDPADGPLDCHIRKVQPRRPRADLFGLDDQQRRFLRRPYPFFDGLDSTGLAVNGLQFIAFMKSIQQQFEHVVNMWQMNPDFPVDDAGIDQLYAHQILSTVDGGYYFCPPGLKSNDDFFGSGMF